MAKRLQIQLQEKSGMFQYSDLSEVVPPTEAEQGHEDESMPSARQSEEEPVRHKPEGLVLPNPPVLDPAVETPVPDSPFSSNREDVADSIVPSPSLAQSEPDTASLDTDDSKLDGTDGMQPVYNAVIFENNHEASDCVYDDDALWSQPDPVEAACVTFEFEMPRQQFQKFVKSPKDHLSEDSNSSNVTADGKAINSAEVLPDEDQPYTAAEMMKSAKEQKGTAIPSASSASASGTSNQRPIAVHSVHSPGAHVVKAVTPGIDDLSRGAMDAHPPVAAVVHTPVLYVAPLLALGLIFLFFYRRFMWYLEMKLLPSSTPKVQLADPLLEEGEDASPSYPAPKSMGCAELLLPMIQISVAMPSGHGETFSLEPSSKVGDLRVLAQKSFQRGFLRFIAPDHSMVDPTVSLQTAGLKDGDHLTAIAVEAKVAATNAAFALFYSGGDRVVAWGNPRLGGDSSQVQDQLRCVQQVQASAGAFAAILSDGSVVAWGDPDAGGDISEVKNQLKGVQQVQATCRAFAAILENGLVVTWGDPNCGGDSSEVALVEFLQDVQQVQAAEMAFAAILADGSVVTWGRPDYGGDSSEVQHQLKDVQQIQSTSFAFAAIMLDGSVVTWGHPDYGGDSSEVQEQLNGVQQVQAAEMAFAAILADGSVVTWGRPDYGGDSSEVQHQLKDVQQIQANDYAFAAILLDGSVVTWGEARFGGDSSEVQHQLKDVQQIQANDYAFAAILADGSIVTWHSQQSGGNSSKVQDQLKGVLQIQARSFSFAAILADGSVVAWGNSFFHYYTLLYLVCGYLIWDEYKSSFRLLRATDYLAPAKLLQRFEEEPEPLPPWWQDEVKNMIAEDSWGLLRKLTLTAPVFLALTFLVSLMNTLRHVAKTMSRGGLLLMNPGIDSSIMIIALPMIACMMSYRSVTRMWMICCNSTVGSLGFVEDFTGKKTWVARLVVCQNMYETNFLLTDLYESWALLHFANLALQIITASQQRLRQRQGHPLMAAGLRQMALQMQELKPL
eukprot:s350_g22.t1